MFFTGTSSPFYGPHHWRRVLPASLLQTTTVTTYTFTGPTTGTSGVPSTFTVTLGAGYLAGSVIITPSSIFNG